MSSTASPRIAVIGGGAAGLAAARVMTRDVGMRHPNCQVVVLEKDTGCGGVWKYDATKSKVNHPMYSGLRTNLPREVMAYREFPWKYDDDKQQSSYATHAQVLQYLQAYARHFDLESNIQFGATVQKLSVVPGTQSVFQQPDEKEQSWPQFRLDWLDIDDQEYSGVFDAVCVCNGHYDKPAIPQLAGLKEFFSGRTMHSVAYDDPTDFEGQTVLCIGGRASGADVARELVSRGGAKHVYLSDTTCTGDPPVSHHNVTLVPKTVEVLPGGEIRFDLDCVLTPEVDVIIFCTGYDYSFPFILADDPSNGEPLVVAAQRRVSPLYEQLWHARYPNLSFCGLPHSVVPFPLFELQMEAFAQQLSGRWTLPAVKERLAEAQRDAMSGGEGRLHGRVPADTHFLGNVQWEYSRRMAAYAGLLLDNDDNNSSAVLDYIATNKVRIRSVAILCCLCGGYK
jgi:hypothetical protein